MKKTFILMLALMVSVCMKAQQTTYKTVKNLPYSTSTDAYAQERCKLDVYHPENQQSNAPVVVWFHGGGLTGGEKFIPEELKNNGYVVIGANYRLIPRVTLDSCINDAAAAVAWAFKHAKDYGGDPGKIIVSGHSAGGYLTSMIGLDKQWLARYNVDADSIYLLAPYSGQVITHFAHRERQGIKATQPTIDQWAPLFHVRPDCPPILIIAGDREMELFGRYEENAYFWRMLKLVGHKAAFLYEIDGHDHGAMAHPAHHILKEHIKKMEK